MATEPVARPQGWPEPDTKGYEKSDIRAKWIGGVVAFLIVGAITIHFISALQLRTLKKSLPTRDAWSSPNQPLHPEIPTNAPRLQLSARADLEDLRAREDSELNTYGWIDKTQGIARIPIQEAMNLIVEKGLLPVREGARASQTSVSTLQLQQGRPTNAEGVRK
jgi:hypothetical protein